MKKIFILKLSLISLILVGSAFAQEEVSDPLEPINRGIFWFNDKFDVHLLEPVARGYHDAMPDRVERGFSNFFDNLATPKYLLSDLIQLKFGQFATHTGRFVVNTILGLGGFIDVADTMGMEKHSEDFGVTLAYYDIPPGPYLVLPFLGPSNLRDAIGRGVDFLLSPQYLIGYADMHWDEELAVTSSYTALNAVHTRAELLDAIEAGKEAALDLYLFSQSAYMQYREGLLYDGANPEKDPFADD